MRILIISEAFGKNYYGVEQVLIKLNEQLRLRNITCKILVADVGDLSGIEVDIKKIPADIFERSFRWHPVMYRFFIEEMTDFRPDLVHVHGMFTFIQRTAVQAARAMRIPVLLSLHGMLEDWTWRQKGRAYFWVKHLYWRLLLYPVFKQVHLVHVITLLEAETANRELPQIPKILIPNAIDLLTLPDLVNKPEKVFVFLGRLHPKKGVDLLIKAFFQSRLWKDWRLVIAGPDDDPNYGKRLCQLVKDLHIEERVRFIGPIYEDEKYQLLANAWVVVVPSYSEVVALVNLEAAAVATPTITTHLTGLHDWEQGGGLLVDANEDQFTQALVNVASWSMDDRIANGKKARQFVKERYGWGVIGQKWLEAYQMIELSIDR